MRRKIIFLVTSGFLWVGPVLAVNNYDIKAAILRYGENVPAIDVNHDGKINTLDIFSPKLPSVPIKAFPGAAGFGTDTVGGRGGQVIEVTNLNDTGAGSLRAAIAAVGPRLVVFRTGGYIDAASELKINNPYITIAGQTAPGDGVVIRKSYLRIATHDVIVRGLRLRPGDDPTGSPSTSRDGVTVSGEGSVEVYNVVVDHNSISWGLDENISTWNSKVHDVTFSWNITSEGLYDSIHVDEGKPPGVFDPHSMGLLIGDHSKNVSVHHNLIAHDADRSPGIFGDTSTEIINNVTYNFGGGIYPIKFTDSNLSGLPSLANAIGNTIKRGVNSSSVTRNAIEISDGLGAGSKIYVSGNKFYERDGTFIGTDRVMDGVSNTMRYQVFSPAFSSGQVIAETADTAYNLVLSKAGALAPKRDMVDNYVVDSVRNGTGIIIDCIITCDEPTDRRDVFNGFPAYATGTAPLDTDHDGMPDAWETNVGLDKNNPADRNNLAPSGYTWIEEYINSFF